MIGAQSYSIGRGADGPESGEESGDGESQASRRIRLVFGSISVEAAASMAGSNHPPSDGTVGSKLKVGAAAGAVSRTLFGGRAKSCPS